MSFLEGVSERIRESVVITEVKEDQFSKWVRKRGILDLYSWKLWFESKGKTCRMGKRKIGTETRYALFVRQQWYESRFK